MKKKLIVLYARVFYPSNTGFGNAATALATSILDIPDTELVVITVSDLPAGEEDFSGATVIRLHRDGNFLVRVASSPLIQGIFYRFRLEWVRIWLMEHEQYRLGLPYLRRDDLSLILFETNVYPFLGSRVVAMHPYKTAIRLHAAEDTEMLAYSKKFLFRSTLIKERIFKFCRDCRVITATNPYHLDFFKNILLKGNVVDIWNKYHYDVIPNTLESIDTFSVPDADYDVHTKYNLPNQFCLTIGRLSTTQGWAQKGFADLIKATALLKESGRLPGNFSLVVVGLSQGEQRLSRMLRSAGLESHVVHIEETSRADTLELIRQAKFVVLPSRYEGQSIFLTEALALGKPILATEGTGASHMVHEGKNGSLIPIGDIPALSSALLDLWLKPEEELIAMSAASATLYNSGFSVRAAREAFQRVLRVVGWEHE